MQPKIQQVLAMNTLDAVMNRPEKIVSPELDQLCEQGADMLSDLWVVIDSLESYRDRYKKLLTKVGDAGGDPQTKAAVYLAWKSVHRLLAAACGELGRDE